MFTLQGMVYPLADALATELTLLVKKDKGQIVTKGAIRMVAMGDGNYLPLLNMVKASFVSDHRDESGAAVLMRVLGDLYLYACYALDGGRLTLFIINADKMPLTPAVIAKLNQRHPCYAVSNLLPAIVARYGMDTTGTSWDKETIDADIMGFGRLSHDQQGHERVVEL